MQTIDTDKTSQTPAGGHFSKNSCFISELSDHPQGRPPQHFSNLSFGMENAVLQGTKLT